MSLARRSWPVWAILVLPIALAVVASAMKRYPLHGRLILELVPAFFLLIALGTETLRGGSRAGSSSAIPLVLVLLLAYPCFAAFQNAASAAPARIQSAWGLAQEFIHDIEVRGHVDTTEGLRRVKTSE